MLEAIESQEEVRVHEALTYGSVTGGSTHWKKQQKAQNRTCLSFSLLALESHCQGNYYARGQAMASLRPEAVQGLAFLQ